MVHGAVLLRSHVAAFNGIWCYIDRQVEKRKPPFAAIMMKTLHTIIRVVSQAMKHQTVPLNMQPDTASTTKSTTTTTQNANTECLL